MKIAVFLDGRPGHEKQTYGIVNALSERINTEISEIRVESRFSGALKAVSEFRKLDEKLRASEKKTFPDVPQGFDIAIGTGSTTHPCILAAKLLSGAKAVTCMTPEKIFLPFFDLCFVPLHDMISERSNVMKTLGPPGVNINRWQHDMNSGLVLAGGTDEKSHEWNSSEIAGIISKIISSTNTSPSFSYSHDSISGNENHTGCCVHEDGPDNSSGEALRTNRNISRSTQWTVSTSPRTPDDLDSMLAGICSATGADFRPFTSTPRGWLEKMYDSCGTVWVTADSISMIYEALSAGCRVGVIPVRWKKKENKFQRSLDFLVSEKRIVFFPDSPEESVIAEHLDEAGRCAGEIIRRWQKKN